MSLVVAGSTALAPMTLADKVEAECLALPQGDAPVFHHFGPGIYLREVRMPAGALVVGHCHRASHMNIMLSGRLLLLDDDGSVRVLVAPFAYVSPPGRKVALIVEDTAWCNVIATEERDIDALETLMFDKSDAFRSTFAQQQAIAHVQREVDRIDFDCFLREAGLSADVVREFSETETDQVAMPDGVAPKFTVRASPIEGRGVFVSAPAVADEVIAPARLAGKRTPAGRFTNHSASPNARFTRAENGDIFLVAQRPIAGCVGGGQGDEVTVDYRHALSINLGG